MPSPCSIPLSSELPSADPALSVRADADALGANDQPAGSFDQVLADCDAKSEAPAAAVGSEPLLGAPLSAEQLAYLAAFVMPQPAPSQPVPVALRSDLTGDVSLVRVGDAEQTTRQALASGTEVLHYQLASSGTLPVPTCPVPSAKNAVESTPAPGQQATGLAQKASEPAHASRASTAQSQEMPAAAREKAPGPSIAAMPTIPQPTELPNSTVPMPAGRAANGEQTPEIAATVAPESLSMAASAVATEQNSTPAPRVSSSRALGKRLPEKIAAGSDQAASTGVMTSAAPAKNMNLVPDEQQVKKGTEGVGTRTAKWGDPMASLTRNFDVSAVSTETASASAFRMEAVTTAQTPTEAPRGLEAVSQAAAMVNEIRDIADGLSSLERNSVEVKFDFGSEERLAVKVEYRDGVVHATFRTDNRELREAISREWTSQNAAADNRNYRVADPVFSSSNFSGGQDASRQQQQQRATEERTSFERAAAMSFRGFGSASPSTSTPVPTSRSENSGYLNAIV